MHPLSIPPPVNQERKSTSAAAAQERSNRPITQTLRHIPSFYKSAAVRDNAWEWVGPRFSKEETKPMTNLLLFAALTFSSAWGS